MDHEQLLIVTSVDEEQQSVENALGRSRHALRTLSQLDQIMGELPESLVPLFEDHRKVAAMGLEERLRAALLELESAQPTPREAESQRDRSEADLAAVRAGLELAEERLEASETERHAALALAGELAHRAVVETEAAGLRARVAELEVVLDEARAGAAATHITLDPARVELRRQTSAPETALGEKESLALDLAAAGEARERERRALASRIESLCGRGETTEAMLADLRRQLSERTEALAAAERAARDMRQRMDRLEAAAQDSTARTQALARANTDPESSRLALVTRLDDTAQLLRIKEVALRRAEEQFAERHTGLTQREAGLQARIERLEAERAQLAMDMGLERQERAVLDGRFEALREENARLADDLLRLGAAAGASTGVARPDAGGDGRGSKVRHIINRKGLRG